MSPWVRIDENAMDHPKIAGLPDGAFRLWVQGMSHCQKFLTDGHIDKVSLRGLRSFSPRRVRDLVEARLWTDAEDGAIQIHDYLQWNDSREHVLHVREQSRERIRKLRGRSGSGNGGCNAVTASVQSANDLRSYSGGVVCSSSQQSSSSPEGGAGETRRALDSAANPSPSLQQRAGDFCEWYGETHDRILGLGYIGNPQKDYHAALRLVAKFGDQEIQDAAIVWFGMEDDFATRGTRTVPKFASRMTHCLQLAKRAGVA